MSTSTTPPDGATARGVPAAAAGATGASPQPFLNPSSAHSGDVLYFLLDSARPASPQVLPVLNLAPPGFEPPLGFTIPAAATAADPRGLPGRTAAPGQHLGSTAHRTPGVELGAQPVAPRVSPASAFSPPGEESLRGSPSAVAGVGGVSLQPVISALGVPADRPYFLRESGPAGSSAPIGEPQAPAFSPELLPLAVTEKR